MRVITNPGTIHEAERSLANVMTVHATFANGEPTRVQLGLLIEMLVEKGVLTLADCRALGAPHMEEVK